MEGEASSGRQIVGAEQISTSEAGRSRSPRRIPHGGGRAASHDVASRLLEAASQDVAAGRRRRVRRRKTGRRKADHQRRRQGDRAVSQDVPAGRRRRVRRQDRSPLYECSDTMLREEPERERKSRSKEEARVNKIKSP